MPQIRQLTIEFDELPDLVRRHRMKYPDTPAVEAFARTLIKNDFSAHEADCFVYKVCKWGGYAGIWGKVRRRNEPQAISDAMRRAYHFLTRGRPVDGLREVSRLKCLGRPSFASKHLRFLAPWSAVVLDSIISGNLGYPYRPEGYALLLADCSRFAHEVNKAGVEHPFRPGEDWYVSDVELAVFAKLRGL